MSTFSTIWVLYIWSVASTTCLCSCNTDYIHHGHCLLDIKWGCRRRSSVWWLQLWPSWQSPTLSYYTLIWTRVKCWRACVEVSGMKLVEWLANCYLFYRPDLTINSLWPTELPPPLCLYSWTTRSPWEVWTSVQLKWKHFKEVSFKLACQLDGNTGADSTVGSSTMVGMSRSGFFTLIPTRVL